jgi:N-formylglutamate amidohydrolase
VPINISTVNGNKGNHLNVQVKKNVRICKEREEDSGGRMNEDVGLREWWKEREIFCGWTSDHYSRPTQFMHALR